MLSAQQISYAHGETVLFEDVTFHLQKGQKMALIGRNGCGKSTLLKILIGQTQPHTGAVSWQKGSKIAYLDQHRQFNAPSVLEEVVQSLPEHYHGLSYPAEQILQGLGIDEQKWLMSPQELSGGYRLRLALACLLAQEPDALLLDEPTNHLDLPSCLWLADFLQQAECACILISHDRGFLDQVCTITGGLCQKRFFEVKGSTETYFEHLMQRQKDLSAQKARLEKERARQMAFIERFRAKATKAAQVKSREKRLAKQPKVQEWVMAQNMVIELPAVDRCLPKLIECRQMEFSYTALPKPLIGPLSLEWGLNDRMAFVGANGQGKSTLLNLMMSYLTPQKGQVIRHPQARIGYFGQRSIEALPLSLSPLSYITQKAPQFSQARLRQLLGAFGVEGEMQERPLSSLSGGERARVILAELTLEPTHGLILDEPTHHLDVETIESLMHALELYEGAVILVSHCASALEAFMPDLLLVFEQSKQSVFKGELDTWLKLQKEKQIASKTQAAKNNSKEGSCVYLEKKEQDKQRRQLQKQAKTLLEKSQAQEKQIQNIEQEIASHLESGKHALATSLNSQLKQLYEDYEQTVGAWFDLCQELEQTN